MNNGAGCSATCEQVGPTRKKSGSVTGKAFVLAERGLIPLPPRLFPVVTPLWSAGISSIRLGKNFARVESV